jgi:cobalamin transport system ATP-binding protein
MTHVALRGLTLRIGRATLLEDVTLELAAGQWCTVIGPNGAGKTTLVETVAGIRRASVGAVEIDGVEVTRLSERERARLVSLVPQHPEVPAGMSVGDYVGLGRLARRGWMRGFTGEDRRATTSVLERLSLADYVERDVATLSGGERQRAVLGRALAQTTPLMVLDEPITGLDLRHQMELLELLRREVSECGLTVLATLHDLTLAGQFADRLVLLDHGRVVLDGPAREVVRSPELAARYEMDLRVVEIDGADVVVPVRRRD